MMYDSLCSFCFLHLFYLALIAICNEFLMFCVLIPGENMHLYLLFSLLNQFFSPVFLYGPPFFHSHHLLYFKNSDLFLSFLVMESSLLAYIKLRITLSISEKFNLNFHSRLQRQKQKIVFMYD